MNVLNYFRSLLWTWGETRSKAPVSVKSLSEVVSAFEGRIMVSLCTGNALKTHNLVATFTKTPFTGKTTLPSQGELNV